MRTETETERDRKPMQSPMSESEDEKKLYYTDPKIYTNTILKKWRPVMRAENCAKTF